MQKSDYETANPPKERINSNSINVFMHAGGNMGDFYIYLSLFHI